MIVANLMEKKWLLRSFHVLSPEGVFEVTYDGKGIGYEEILVNGEVACRKRSLWWYVPTFEFSIGSLKSQITVKIGVWSQIRSFSLIVDGETIYSEN